MFFDIDGTLVPSTSSGRFLAERFGHARDVATAEERYAAGTMSNHDVSVIDAAGWAGSSVSTVASWLDELPLIAGIDYVVQWCHARDLVPGRQAWLLRRVSRYLTVRPLATAGRTCPCSRRLGTRLP